MTRLFYERHVPADPLIGPLFADMAPDHPDRVAAWLGEVFGGPTFCSGRCGGYPRMLSQHLGRSITAEQRARWAELLIRSADEAGLPTDPEWRALLSLTLSGAPASRQRTRGRARPAAADADAAVVVGV